MAAGKRCAVWRTIHGGGCNGAVHDVVNLVVFEREALGQPAPNFVQRHHGPERKHGCGLGDGAGPRGRLYISVPGTYERATRPS